MSQMNLIIHLIQQNSGLFASRPKAEISFVHYLKKFISYTTRFHTALRIFFWFCFWHVRLLGIQLRLLLFFLFFGQLVKNHWLHFLFFYSFNDDMLVSFNHCMNSFWLVLWDLHIKYVIRKSSQCVLFIISRCDDLLFFFGCVCISFVNLWDWIDQIGIVAIDLLTCCLNGQEVIECFTLSRTSQTLRKPNFEAVF
jgi:hypothetical protein